MAAAALPKWVMLERFVFRRDDPNSFREDKRTSATCTTCTGARFQVSFILAEPPTPSRIYLSWPEGPESGVCHLLGANRDLVLLRLDSLLDESEPFGDARYEYFIYIAADPILPLLRPLPQCMEYDTYFERPSTCPLPSLATGLLCRGDDEFAVAGLLRILCTYDTSEMQAELWVLRSSLSCCESQNWEKKLLPIPYQEDEYYDLFHWVTNEVVPFNNFLCWVNYARGILFCDGIFGDSPKISYIRFPLDSFVRGDLRDDPRRIRKDLYRRLCVTDAGSRLVSLDVARHDGTGFGPMAPGTGFTLTIRTLEMVHMPWKWVDDAVITSAQLWAANTACLPHDVMMLPLLSMDVPNIVHLVLFDWEVGRFSLVAIDSSDKQVLGSVVTYIKSWEEGRLSSDDADMVEAKPRFFMHFLPSEFPKFLNLNR